MESSIHVYKQHCACQSSMVAFLGTFPIVPLVRTKFTKVYLIIDLYFYLAHPLLATWACPM